MRVSQGDGQDLADVRLSPGQIARLSLLAEAEGLSLDAAIERVLTAGFTALADAGEPAPQDPPAFGGSWDEPDAAMPVSEARFQAMFDNAAVGIAYVGLDGRWQLVNDRLCEITGHSRSELLQRTFQEMTHPDDMAADMALLQRAMAGEIPYYAIGKRYLRPDGTPVWVNLTVSLVRDAAGVPLCGIAVVEDIRERRQMEQALLDARDEIAQSLSQLQAVINNISEGLVILDPQGRLVAVNRAALDIYGLPRDTVPHGRLQDFVGRFELSDLDGRLLPLAEWPMARAVRGEAFQGLELRGTHKDTGRRWICSYSGTPVHDEAGEPIAAVISFREVTAEREMQAALRTSEERFRFLAENVPQLIWRALPDGTIDYFNHRWVSYTGMAVSEAHAEAWGWLVHPEDAPSAFAAWSHSLATGEPYQVEYRLRRADGNYRWHLVRGVAMRDDAGRILHWFGTCTDIEEQRQAIRLRDDFLSIASHELRTPLTSLSLQIESALRRIDKEDLSLPGWLTGKLAGAERQLGRLDTLVRQLLDVSRITSGRLQVELTEVDLAAIVREVAVRFRDQAEAQNCRLDIVVPETLIGRSDASRLDQIVTNLVSNGVKYGAGRPVAITLGTEGVTAVLTVQDQGMGIASEDHARIFERFERAASVRHFGGFGLGLWIVRQLVEGLGGTISLQSRPGQGAAFTVRLPLAGP